MSAIIDALHARFVELDFGVAVCQYFLESCYEALDAYHRDLSSEPCPWSEFSVPELIAVIREERERQPSFETDGYTSNLPTWLISKEQLIWNIWVCALYGPASARPLLVDSPDLLASQGYAGKTDVITELAQTSFLRYTTDRIASQSRSGVRLLREPAARFARLLHRLHQQHSQQAGDTRLRGAARRQLLP